MVLFAQWIGRPWACSWRGFSSKLNANGIWPAAEKGVHRKGPRPLGSDAVPQNLAGGGAGLGGAWRGWHFFVLLRTRTGISRARRPSLSEPVSRNRFHFYHRNHLLQLYPTHRSDRD